MTKIVLYYFTGIWICYICVPHGCGSSKRTTTWISCRRKEDWGNNTLTCHGVQFRSGENEFLHLIRCIVFFPIPDLIFIPFFYPLSQPILLHTLFWNLIYYNSLIFCVTHYVWQIITLSLFQLFIHFKTISLTVLDSNSYIIPVYNPFFCIWITK